MATRPAGFRADSQAPSKTEENMMLSCFQISRLRRTIGWWGAGLLLVSAFSIAKAQESDPTGAVQYQLSQRAYPNNGFDPGATARALTQRARMAPAHIGAPLTGGFTPDTAGLSATWTYLGPNNLLATDNTYNGPGALSGRVSCAAFDPTDSN